MYATETTHAESFIPLFVPVAIWGVLGAFQGEGIMVNGRKGIIVAGWTLRITSHLSAKESWYSLRLLLLACVVGFRVARIARRCVRRNRYAVLTAFDVAMGIRYPACRTVGEIAVLDYLWTSWNRWFSDCSTGESGGHCCNSENGKSDPEHV